MLPRIHQLNPQVANQIAAGEVIERPASVIKELVENSLDAKATRITIEVDKGGMRRLLVTDDGHGIAKEDLGLALSRHATSKIHHLNDLQQIMSLGFRGEALASISSVARVTLSSCLQGEATAWEIHMAGSPELLPPAPCSHPPGTTIAVEDLFFNTPARRQFLRTEKTEFSHIEETVKRLALSHFEVGFTFKHNQRVMFHLPAAGAHGQPSDRISTLCGSAFLQQSLQVEFHATGLKLWGWVGLPEAARSQTDLQYFYLNGRIIRDRLINHAIFQAYQDKLHPGRHPCYVLFLTVAPESVDVNVHPTKHEVRFREGRLVHDFVFRHLNDALSGGETPPVLAGASMHYGSHHHSSPSTLRVHEQMKGYAALHGTENKLTPIVRTEFIQPQGGSATQDAAAPVAKPLGAHSFGKVLSGLSEDFILLESEQGLGVVDIQSAQQRICLGRFLLAQQTGTFSTHPLLIPTIIQLSAPNASLFERLIPDLLTLGIVINSAGPLTYVVRQLPDFLRQLAVVRAFTEIPEKLKGHFADDAATRCQLLAELLAHYVANSAKITTLHDMNQLLDELAFVETACSQLNAKSAIKWFSLDELTL